MPDIAGLDWIFGIFEYNKGASEVLRERLRGKIIVL